MPHDVERHRIGASARRWIEAWTGCVRRPGRPLPTIFHVTHWKAGSQWIHKILDRCARDRIVPAEHDTSQLLKRPVLAGRVYSTCYVTREQLHSVPLPEPWRRFVVIRDLRDTLVSVYFSVAFSHPPGSGVDEIRAVLTGCEREDGLLWLLENWIPYVAAIQRSWLVSGEELIRYEDLLAHDVDILVPLLTERCPLGLPRQQVRDAVLACRFERLTGGRSRGQEDVHSHERKGVAGDWRTYFTERVTRDFKARFGDLLIATGYENDLHWSAR